MPIYEYECTACGFLHEVIQKVSDAHLTDCSTCGGKSTLKKRISAAGFRLSGSGWYETDFKREGKRNLAERDSSKPASTKESKSSDKPAKSEKKKSATGGK